MKKILGLLAFALGLSSLTGCGLKGPLYFPPSSSEQSVTVDKSAADNTQTAPMQNDRSVGQTPTQVPN